MHHVNHLRQNGSEHDIGVFIKRASGRYYTGEIVGRRLAEVVAKALAANSKTSCLKIIDPFGGDGRLVEWLITAWLEQGYSPVSWDITIVDLDDVGFERCRERIDSLLASGANIEATLLACDAFVAAKRLGPSFDAVITNPPWELLKPDRREIARLPTASQQGYVEHMRHYDNWLCEQYPLSKPKRKFAGWGTNLSRVGLEASLLLTRPAGIVGAVLPASILADEQSFVLRKHLLTEHALLDVAYFPAEQKHYESADVESVTIVAQVNSEPRSEVPFCTPRPGSSNSATSIFRLDKDSMESVDYVLPVALGTDTSEILEKIASRFPRWRDLEGGGAFWAGREVDETGSAAWLRDSHSNGEGPLFIKGRMIDRFSVPEVPLRKVGKMNWSSPASSLVPRIVWRDVSRPNQKRRMIATLIPAGWVAGNSLGVACFKDGDESALRALLGVMTSTSFEFQLRGYLATGHVSLGSLRKVALPSESDLKSDTTLSILVQRRLHGDMSAEIEVDAYVAHSTYGLSRGEYAVVLNQFSKLTEDELDAFLSAYDRQAASQQPTAINMDAKAPVNDHISSVNSPIVDDSSAPVQRIANHRSARLSDVDMQMVRAIPEGGNWKDIPTSIPSRRLEQIRESYLRGEGSRSTYYGRLRRDRPAYTINTYFNRPGNGCHVHYEQDRVLSQREAARLQGFPDSFEFFGAQGAICTQIGNAVPPLLSYQVARTLGPPGAFIDLFCGAGGMGLGFKWAGWHPIVANDIERVFLETYGKNVHDNTVVGSLTDEAVFKKLVTEVKKVRLKGQPLWVLGGPPCQGFSTAGKARSMDDPRNHLFLDYVRFLKKIRPDGFVFENVTGLLNMQGGEVFSAVRNAFSVAMPHISDEVLSAEEFAIPQRRKRIILVGTRVKTDWQPPEKRTTATNQSKDLFGLAPWISVEEAISDLPALTSGENGEARPYRTQARTTYQGLMRGLLTPAEYLDDIWRGKRAI